MYSIAKPQYQSYIKRLKTFETWSAAPTPESLASAGLFHTSTGIDDTQCFFCGIRIYAWEPTDNPLSEHLRWSKHCIYANLMKTVNTSKGILEELQQSIALLESAIKYNGAGVDGTGIDVAGNGPVSDPTTEHRLGTKLHHPLFDILLWRAKRDGHHG